ncbi:hypothetical protein C2E23DRAFT_819785 [Lenzites betulinus]|nr:hypothetical protein C2E23DRAFT_819785 [Lenzites betulinus]
MCPPSRGGPRFRTPGRHRGWGSDDQGAIRNRNRIWKDYPGTTLVPSSVAVCVLITVHSGCEELLLRGPLRARALLLYSACLYLVGMWARLADAILHRSPVVVLMGHCAEIAVVVVIDLMCTLSVLLLADAFVFTPNQPALDVRGLRACTACILHPSAAGRVIDGLRGRA